MMRSLTSIDLAPILPAWLLVVLATIAVLALVPALLRRARGAWWRALAFLLILGAIANPRLVQQTRETRPDIALLAVDNSASTTVAGREAAIAAARAQIEARAGRLPDLELRTVTAEEGGRQGTRLFAAIERGLVDIPRTRLAGIIALSDGQVHDVPANFSAEAPVHLLLPGRAGEVDRRLRIIEAPGFGIVGRGVELRLVVEDLGAPANGAPVRLSIRRDGAAPRTESVVPGREHRIALPIERGGPSVIEITAEERPGEVSTVNNSAIVTVNGVRDRLRVLLVSGEPHAGERTWRRLLKADPNVDLVHFTILRPPEKDDLTPLNELALIAFPVRELFQQKLREFDLIVFDRFSNRGILPPQYLRNIAEHVRQGGALLMSVGPEFTGPASLANTPLGAVLPARPLPGSQALLESAFRAQVSETGLRHPVTEGLTGANANAAAQAGWGRWYRMLRAEARSGANVMNGPDGNPLLLLDRVGEGRVALLLSDQIWLWSRGHDGGGPQAELLRRIAHWLMREPELEEEDLTAAIAQGQLTVTRRSIADTPPPEITVTAPDGTQSRHAPERRDGGRAVVEMPVTRAGVWAATDGTRTAFAAAEAANPPEVADLRADAGRMGAVVQASGGAARWIGDGSALPDLRRVSMERDAAGPGWIGLVRREDHSVTGISALPLLPPWLALLLVLGVAVIAWRREGR
ncbi:hypothetical protein [Roseomonas sp. WA12]